MRLGILTGGGDCPGLNAAIRSACQTAWNRGDEMMGFARGWRGLLNEPLVTPLSPSDVQNIHRVGGTFLTTSRTNPGKSDSQLREVIDNLSKLKIDGLIAIGGDDTLSVAVKLDAAGAKVVGVPKTIDNDVPETDFCIGFDSATRIVSDAIDTVYTTVASHRRAIVVEAMGRNAGWLAAIGGIAGGADFIAVPEEPAHIDSICQIAKQAFESKGCVIGVVAEGANVIGISTQAPSTVLDAFGHELLVERGLGNSVADAIEKKTGIETRAMVLGHLQRGGTPTVFDRVLGTRFGIAAVDYLHNGKAGHMTALHGQEIVPVPIQKIAGRNRGLDTHIIETLREMRVLPEGTPGK